MKDFLKVAFYPTPEPEKFDTGLRYTDILFGLVIRELFLRLQNWANLDYVVQWHLVVGLTLVLGSWIGFRRSLNRPQYQLKFVNIPLLRFLVDQLMLILYFRIAVLTPVPEATTILISGSGTAGNLARETTKLVFCVFFLYAIWDGLGMRMKKAKIKTAEGGTRPRYPVVEDDKMTDKEQSIDWWGVWITWICLLFFGALCFLSHCLSPFQIFVATTVLLIVYRWFKEIRTSYQLPRPV